MTSTMRSVAWELSVLYILASTATAIIWNPDARHARYVGYVFDSLSAQELSELQEADLAFQRCTADAVSSRFRPHCRRVERYSGEMRMTMSVDH